MAPVDAEHPGVNMGERDLEHVGGAVIPAVQRTAYSVAETCQSLGLSRGKVYELMAAGQLAYVKVGARRLVPVSALQAFLAPGARW